MCCDCCSVRQQKAWVFSIGSILLVIGIVLTAGGRPISWAIIDSILPLKPGSYIYDHWVVTPIDLFVTFDLYNWTNSDEYNNPNVKPHFEKLGPYVFRDMKIKEDLIWDNANDTVTFYGRRIWHFDPERSNGSLDDMVIAPHFPTLTASIMSQNMPKIIRKIVNFAVNREGGAVSMKHTAIEWIFDGYYDDLLDFAMRLHSPLIPILDGTFAWFYGRNNSKEFEGTFTVYTGQKNLSRMGDLKLWKGSNQTGFWEGECGKVNGSTGELWSPHKRWDDVISIFIYEASRFINLFPKEKVEYRGLEGWRYESTDQTFDNGYIAPDTKCFCVKNRECPKNGMVDFSPVYFNAPLYVSHPNFYLTDPMYMENITGLQQDPKKDILFAVLEPVLGIPLSVDGHVMVSLRMKRDEYIDYLKDVAYDIYAPLFILSLQAEITDDILNYVKLVLKIPAISQYIGIALLVIGVVMVAIGIWLTKAHKWRGDSKDEPIMEDSKEN